MKLTGNLKKQVEKAETKEEKKSLIENAGMLLNDDELEMVSGGVSEANIYVCENNHYFASEDPLYICPTCGKDLTLLN